VIEVPRTPAYSMPPEAQRALADIGRLAAEFGTRQQAMTAEERARRKEDMRSRERDLERMIREANVERRRAEEATSEVTSARVRKAFEMKRIIVQPKLKAPLADEPPAEAAPAQHTPTPAERQLLRDRSRKIALILGREFDMPVETGGKVVGRVSAQVSPEEVVRRVLGAPSDDGSEVAFAVDSEGHLYTRNDDERRTIESLGIPQKLAANQPLRDIGSDWVAAVTRAGSLRIGVARQIGENFVLLRRAAARNFAYGLALVVIAILGLVPIANHMTRDVQLVTAGAARISQGDLQTRVPVRSKNEFGQLASAFNRMAVDLAEQRLKLHQEEQARREQEVQQGILAVEYDRKAGELEEARRFQLSMLPKCVPDAPGFEVAAFTRTATEVGGDYYDFHVAGDGTLSVTIGDATGHGAKAGTMVTVGKTLFAGYGGKSAPGVFLGEAAETIKRMELGRMAMALSLARFEPGRVTIASAGMPPMLVHRAETNTVEEIGLGATPLGTLGIEYAQREVVLGKGDTILLMSDGFPELTNEAGTQLGYAATLDAFSLSAGGSAQQVIDALVGAAEAWHGDQPPNDDMTFVAVRVAGA
jgi:serine phosphatase RsbU (regulator of sigma subunit)